MSLTGRFCFRRSLLGKVVLCVEEEKKKLWARGGEGTRKRWRDATLMDLTHNELRKILDLRDKTGAVPEPEPKRLEAPQPKVKPSAAPDSVGWHHPSWDDNSIRLNGH